MAEELFTLSALLTLEIWDIHSKYLIHLKASPSET